MCTWHFTEDHVDDVQPLHFEALVQEAASKGYGKLYAVFGGGVEGLRACAAGAVAS